MVRRPTGTSVRVKRPWASAVWMLRPPPTRAPGTTAPEGSSTTPVTVPMPPTMRMLRRALPSAARRMLASPCSRPDWSNDTSRSSPLGIRSKANAPFASVRVTAIVHSSGSGAPGGAGQRTAACDRLRYQTYTGTSATGVEPSARSTNPEIVPTVGWMGAVFTSKSVKSRTTVAPGDGMFSLMNTCAGGWTLTASISTLPTGTRSKRYLPSPSVVVPNWLWSVRLVTLTTVFGSGRPCSSNVWPSIDPRPRNTMSTVRRWASRATLKRSSRNCSVSGSSGDDLDVRDVRAPHVVEAVAAVLVGGLRADAERDAVRQRTRPGRTVAHWRTRPAARWRSAPGPTRRRARRHRDADRQRLRPGHPLAAMVGDVADASASGRRTGRWGRAGRGTRCAGRAGGRRRRPCCRPTPYLVNSPWPTLSCASSGEMSSLNSTATTRAPLAIGVPSHTNWSASACCCTPSTLGAGSATENSVGPGAGVPVPCVSPSNTSKVSPSTSLAWRCTAGNCDIGTSANTACRSVPSACGMTRLSENRASGAAPGRDAAR